jgi:hypothetical protein
MTIATPRRIQLHRAKGWRMPENTVKVDRSTKWGNPFIVGQDGTRAECVDLYKHLLGGLLCLSGKASIESQRMTRNYVLMRLPELRGKNLACWCPLDQPCHADVLLELAKRADRRHDGGLCRL